MKLEIVLFAVVVALFMSATAAVGGVEGVFEADPSAVAEDQFTAPKAATGSFASFSEAERAQLEESGKKYEFDAEVGRLMNIIINSLYSNADVFLRELISNASDALDKARFTSLTDGEYLGATPQLEIRVRTDPEARTLTIQDSGVGMTRAGLVQNLGTIARSGTTEFAKALADGADMSLIGQFGVGFYSAFLVADRVTVTSKSNQDDKQWVWDSTSDATFTVAEDPRGNTLGRGTEVVLHLKEGEEFDALLGAPHVRSLAKHYSEFIDFPIYLWASHEEQVAVEKPAVEEAAADEEEADLTVDEEEDDEDWEDDEDEDEEVETVTVWDWERINDTKPIWTRSKETVSKEEYNKFYQALNKDPQDPLEYIHFSGEGDVNFKSILYIPSEPPQGMFDAKAADVSKLRLYVRRVFISDDFASLPKYLSFVRGVVDSDDLPLNVSRELLQQSRVLASIRKKLVRKAVAMFQSMATRDEEKYEQFWKVYGTNVKLGVIEDKANEERLLRLLRYHSSSMGELVSFDSYVERMQEGQQEIYYLAGTDLAELESSPLLERVVEKGYEVLFMTDPIDEYMYQTVKKYEDYKLVNLAKEGLKLDDDDEETADKKTEYQELFADLLDFFKSHLKGKVSKVVISERLTSSPAALTTSSWGHTANLQRLMKMQALQDKVEAKWYKAQRTMEINPEHPIIRELADRLAAGAADAHLQLAADLVFQTAALRSGFEVENPAEFASSINSMLVRSLGLAQEEQEQTEEQEQEQEQEQDEFKAEL
jgi:heat shock protein 90kDa beta